VPFFQWLRSNSEHYLMEAAQREMAERYGREPPLGRRGLGPLFWQRVFVPLYRLLPWSARRSIMQAMPGSHRRRWQGRAPPHRAH
jgi:hypothetical protein